VTSSLETPEQEHRALLEREANDKAARAGLPLPFPNPWDTLDPTKVPRGATEAQLQSSYTAFRALCRPRPRKRHRL
jgi:hypothetical protein